MRLSSTVSCLLLYLVHDVLAAKYSEYILAPKSRTIYPKSVHGSNGTVTGADSLIGSQTGSIVFQGKSSVTFDFGINIAGPASITTGNSTSSAIGLTYSESSLWINELASDAMADSGLDAIYWLDTTSGAGNHTIDKDHERGGFRYMTLVYNGTEALEVTGVIVNYAAMPHVEDMTDYTGYFHCNDDKINRVWYAGAYTNQICTINPKTGNSLIFLGAVNSSSNISLPDTVPWYLNYTISNGSSALVDGAKRDRLIWPGDMSIAVPSIFVSTNDFVTIKNGLDSLFGLQDEKGRLPYAGSPFIETIKENTGTELFSFTYHMYSLIGLADYYLFGGNLQYVSDQWDPFVKGLNYSLSTIDDTGLMNVTSPADWLRFGMGGHNIEANAILYFTIQQAMLLAEALNRTDEATSWASIGEKVKSVSNSLLWDESAGLYKDNETTTLHPQDGNVWAIKANLTNNATQIASISSKLRERWTPYGAPALEASDAISPFISSFELESHFLARDPHAALDLVRLMWADFMLDDPRMTNSTFIERYASDGRLHYAPYTNDARVSHAHGWATGPTYVLSFFAAGIRLTGANGKTWLIAPQPGDLIQVEAGFVSSLGQFASSLIVDSPNGTITSLNFTTPAGTTGRVELPYPAMDGTLDLSGPNGYSKSIDVKGGQEGTWSQGDLAGGDWYITFRSTGGTIPPSNGTSKLGPEIGIYVILAAIGVYALYLG